MIPANLLAIADNAAFQHAAVLAAIEDNDDLLVRFAHVLRLYKDAGPNAHVLEAHRGRVWAEITKRCTR